MYIIIVAVFVFWYIILSIVITFTPIMKQVCCVQLEVLRLSIPVAFLSVSPILVSLHNPLVGPL